MKKSSVEIDTCVAMTQGSIGYWLQNALTNEFEKRNIAKPVISVVTQVRVDKEDPSFKNHPNQLVHSIQKKKLTQKQPKMALRMWKMLAVATEKLFHHQCLKKLLKKRRFVL